jgi:3-hydroxyisobutyrate dehydrogenase-like beta-hydroxyacid dehydrogenase
MAGGPKDVIEKYTTVCSLIGKVIHVSQEYGKASILKLANNQIIAAQTCAFSLSLGMILKNGRDSNFFILRRYRT